MKKWGRVFDRALRDERILDSKPDIAMMDVVISKLVQRVEQADCPGWRRQLESKYEELQGAIKSRRQGDVGAHMTALGDLIKDGARIDQLSDDLVKTLDRRAQTAQREVALGIRREERVTVAEVTKVFAAW